MEKEPNLKGEAALAVDDPEVRAAFGALTPSQRSRMLAHIAGESANAIARREGVHHSSVAESLRSTNVKNTIKILGFSLAAHRVDDDGLVEVNTLEMLVGNVLAIALNATRTIVTPVGEVLKVPDYRTRLDASVRLLAMIEPPATTPKPSVGVAPDVPEAASVELSRTTTERVTVTTPQAPRKNRRGA